MHIVVTDLHDRWPPRQIPVASNVTIGRDPACAVVLEDPQLGPLQTRITITATSMTIENVGASARTRVNGESIGKRGRVLMDRAAVIEIGDYILRFSAVASRRVRPATTLAPDAGGVEHTFLDALRARPGDLDTRLVYADWLEQQDRLPMAAVVRHAASNLPLDPETREVARWMDAAWRATVWCGPIEHCSAGPEGPRPPCPRRWEHLPSGDEPNRRPCTSCSHDVELLDNLAAIDDRAFGTDAPFVVCPSLDRARVVAELDARRRQRLDRAHIVVGRPARVDGVPRLAELRAGAAWSGPARAATADPALRPRAAEVWAQAAREEHASIAAFSGLSLQLLSLGAPPELIAACHAAALDEIRHAQRSFEIASSFAGSPLAPSRLDEAARVGGPTTPRELARETLFDGCINETAAALEARHAAAGAGGWLAPILAGIADDEERHAELAWQIVAWCVQVTGADLADELARDLASVDVPAIPDTADDPALLACGVIGERGRAEARAHAIARATARLATLTG